MDVAAVWSLVERAAAQLARVSPTLLLAGLALHALKLAARARAWQNVLRAAVPERRLRYRDAAAPYLAGAGASAVMPFGGGDLLRIALAATRLRCGGGLGRADTTAIAAGSMAVERALDVVVSGIVLGLALALGQLPGSALHGRLAAAEALLTQPVVALGLAGAIGLAAAAGWRLRHRLSSAAGGVLCGLSVLGRPKRYLTSVASWQLLGWGFRVGALVLLLEAFHVRGALAVAPILLSLQLLADALPVTPAGAGTQQALVAAALGSAAMVGFSAGAQAATLLVDLALGMAALASCGVGVRLRALRAVVASA
jgi:Lysylphosphatidylglycerol synthase TM region